MDFSTLKVNDEIKYIGNDWLRWEDSTYKICRAEDTYLEGRCPESLKGQIGILELTASDMVIFFTLSHLNPAEWELVTR